MTEREFIVVGSGAGGACVAGRLAEEGAGVLLIERGGPASPRKDAMEAVSRYYAQGGFSSALGNALLPIPTGTAVGGSTTINSGTCLRPPAGMLESWESGSGGAFRAAEFSGFVEEAWRRLKVKTAPEGTLSRSSRLILEGFHRMGHAAAPLDRCEEGCTGTGRCCFVCPTGGKMTSKKAFLDPLAGNEALVLRPRTELTSIEPPVRSGDPVRVRVRSLETGEREELRCRTLVLSAGTLHTPYFLRKFRLGRWREAGSGLSVHPASKLFGLFDEPVRGWEGVPQGVGLEDPRDGAIRYEGVYTPPELAAITLPLEGLRLKRWMDAYDRVATFGFMIQDESRGSVRYPFGPTPLIRYSLGERDLSRMVRAARFTAEAFFAAGARKVVLPFNIPGNETDSVEELRKADLSAVAPGGMQMMAFHPLGTCAAGRVVDWDLGVCPGVFICDGSVVPQSLGVNPQMTIYAFALRLARRLLGSRA
ncbi:MAG: GMC family oxidoreductase [Elusimicrobiota bacterium]